MDYLGSNNTYYSSYSSSVIFNRNNTCCCLCSKRDSSLSLLLEILTPQEAFSGFSNSNVILFSGMFVVGVAMLESGLAQTIGNFIVRKVGGTQHALIPAFMVLTIVLSAFASEYRHCSLSVACNYWCMPFC